MKYLLVILIALIFSCEKYDYPDVENIQVNFTQETAFPVNGYVELPNGQKYCKWDGFSGLYSCQNITPPKSDYYVFYFESLNTAPMNFHIDTYTHDGNFLRHQTFYPKKIGNKMVIHQIITR